MGQTCLLNMYKPMSNTKLVNVEITIYDRKIGGLIFYSIVVYVA